MTTEERIAALEKRVEDQEAAIARLDAALAGYTTPNAVSNALLSMSASISSVQSDIGELKIQNLQRL